MDNSTILAWIFTALLLIVGYMLGKHSRISIDKKKNEAKNATKTKVLIFANDVGNKRTTWCIDSIFGKGRRNLRVSAKYCCLNCPYWEIWCVWRKWDDLIGRYVAVHVKDETRGKAIRNELLDAGLNTIQKTFFPEVGNGEEEYDLIDT